MSTIGTVYFVHYCIDSRSSPPAQRIRESQMINCSAPQRRKCAEISCTGDCADAEWMSTPAECQSRPVSLVFQRDLVVQLPGSNNLVHRRHNGSNRQLHIPTSVPRMLARHQTKVQRAQGRSRSQRNDLTDARSAVICHNSQRLLTAFTFARHEYKDAVNRNVSLAISQHKYRSQGAG